MSANPMLLSFSPHSIPTPASPTAKLPTRLEIPASSTGRPRGPTTPTQRLPPTALFHGPHSRNASRISLVPPDKSSPIEPPQHLPRADPPTSSFSGPRPTLIGHSRLQNTKSRDDDFRADALWVEMQKTLADVELSAMNSSHVFSPTHAKALEELRTAQLGLAQAWAKSEADEIRDEEFSNETQEISSVGPLKQGMYNSGASPNQGKNRSRPGSSSSAAERALEEETEKDIQLARRRREANDRYFEQVNKGVLAVVRKLDDVANAMRRVEKESREIWDESSGTQELDNATDTEISASAEATDTDVMPDSPVRMKS